jgi:hypothetical protein
MWQTMKPQRELSEAECDLIKFFATGTSGYPERDKIIKTTFQFVRPGYVFVKRSLWQRIVAPFLLLKYNIVSKLLTKRQK